MSYENVVFESEKNVQMTSFSMKTTNEIHLHDGNANEAFDGGGETDFEKGMHSLPRSRHTNNASSPPSTPSIKSKSMVKETKSRRMSNATSSLVEMPKISSISKNGDSTAVDGHQDSTPHVATKSTIRVDANNAGIYESSQLFFYIQIAFFAMCGCLCRIGSDKIFGSLAGIESQDEIVNQSFFSNIFGSFVLGALNGSPMGKTRLAALYKGLTTGFCGSFTTWSKWNQQLSLTLIGENGYPSQTQVLSIASWFIGFYSYIGSYCVGIDFGKDIGGKIGKHVSRNGPKLCDYIVSVLLILAVIGFALGVAFDVSEESKGFWLAVLFAPFGACLRAWLSQFKIERFKFPLGTFLANLLGALVLATLHVINQQAAEPNCTAWQVSICWPTIVTYGIGTGFCACLTTISTFMSEIYKLRPEHPRFAYSYAIITVVACQILCGIINGVNHTVRVAANS